MDAKKTKRIEKIFPDYFDRFKLPFGAREESLKVYRACRSGKCDRASFLPSFEEHGYQLNPSADPEDPGQYSLSTFEKPTHVKRFAGATSDMEVPYQIAIGFTDPKHGLVQRTRERKKKSGSHVDWWLYRDATPYDEFEMIIDFEEHLNAYIQERDKENERICQYR
ncbi:MAG: hypothetical protein Q4C63_08405 [Eubacteriales bacterium]|nr:hypothetical protein [Eubacteriales bacterium]